jgi:hypothetical protein
MLLKSDSQGFLIGYSLQGDRAEQLLSALKGDTGKLLALMRRAGNAPLLPTVSAPRVRSGSGTPRMFDVGPSSPREMASPIAREARIERMAAQTQALAREAVSVRRREVIQSNKDAAAHQLRDGRGRFTGGGHDGAPGAGQGAAPGAGNGSGGEHPKNQPRAGKGKGGASSNIGDGLGKALDATQQVDQLLGAANEARGLYGNLKSAAVPLGRAGSALLGSIRRPPASKEDKEQTGLLRKLLKQGEKNGSKVGEGGGLLALLNLIPGLGAVVQQVGLITGSVAVGGALRALAGAGVLMLARRLPAINTLLASWDAWNEIDEDDANDKLTEDEKSRRHAVSVGGVAGTALGSVGGALAGAALGSIVPVIGTAVGAAVGAAVGGYFGHRDGRAAGGTAFDNYTRGMFESGGDPGAVSTGVGDAGGKSYGTHQLSSSTGTLQKFLSSSPYGMQFAGLKVGSPEFDAQWKRLAAGEPGFARSQDDFIDQTHFAPQMAKLKAAGLDLSGRGDAVTEAVRSTATQFGPNSSVITSALAGSNVGAMSDAEIVSAIQDFKAANNASLFKSSSPAVQAGTLNRAFAEKAALLALTSSPSTASSGIPAMPRLPAVPMISAPGAAPQIDLGSFGRVNSQPAMPAAPAPSPVAGQDVRDRAIAHIVTGGMGEAARR